MSNLASIENRLTRMETKLIRGFEELAVDTDIDPDWLSVQDGTIFISNMGRSLKVIMETAKKKGAKIGEHEYEIVHKGRAVAWV